MGAVDHEEYDANDKSSKVEGVLARAASVDDLFGPLWSLNMCAGAEEPEVLQAQGSGFAALPTLISNIEKEPGSQEALTEINGAEDPGQQGKGGRKLGVPGTTREISFPRATLQVSDNEVQDVKPTVVQPGLEALPTDANGAKCGFRPNPNTGAEGGLTQSQSTSDDDQLTGSGVDERRQKRMLSNRESARRSRLRKQQHLDELRAQVAQLRAENNDMMAKFCVASQQYAQITAENHTLRTDALNLGRKLQQVNQVVSAQNPNGLRALGILPGHQDNLAPGHLSSYYQPLPGVPDQAPRGDTLHPSRLYT